MRPKEYFVFIWNGGLDPARANPGSLRQRRTLSTTIFLLLPVVIALIIANFTVYDAGDQNVEVGAVLALGVLGLGLQAHKGWDRFASILLVASIWFASTSIIFREGFNSANWVWMTSAVLIAILVTTRRIAIAYTALVIITLLVFAALTDLGYLRTGLVLEQHALAVAISGSLNLIIMCVVGFAFRTNQIETEQMLNANARKLDEEVSTRLKAEREALAGKRAKNTFLTTISHELRTPLNGVIGAGELLAASPLTPEQRDLVQVIRKSGEDLLDLIENVLDLSRLEAGRLELESKAFHFRSAIQSSMEPIIEKGRKKAVSVAFHVAEKLPQYVQGDEVRLNQIIKNLCGNAVNFTEAGRVELIASYTNGELELTVADTGIGITQEVKEDVFQPFVTRARPSDERHVGSTGLGLTIVADLVNLLGGTINLWSEPDVGSVFTVTLPMPAGESTAKKPPGKPRPQKQPGISPLVLVTDENPVNRLILSKLLRILNCRVMEAADHAEAIEVLSRNSIDMVLMDVCLPHVDGIKTTTAIRAMQGPQTSIPIVGLTASSTAITNTELLAAGMTRCIVKPVSLQQLQTLLEGLIYNRISALT